MKRQDIKAIPKTFLSDDLHDIRGVWIIPNGKKHESGWACMDFVVSIGQKMVRFGGKCDDISFIGSHFRMDCDYPSRIIHIWNTKGNFDILNCEYSSVTFIQR